MEHNGRFSRCEHGTTKVGGVTAVGTSPAAKLLQVAAVPS